MATLCCLVAAQTSRSASSTLSEPGKSERKPLPLMRDVCSLPSTVSSEAVPKQQLYHHLFIGYQLPAVWYNTVMKKSIIDPRLNYREYDLPTLPSCDERKDMPAVSTGTVSIEDPNHSEVTHKAVLPKLITIRRRKMKKHKLKKLRKRMRFVMRRQRQRKEKRKELRIQQYEKDQANEGQMFDAEQYIDEHLALARKSGWHVDIISEFNRDRKKESAAGGSSDSSSK